MLRNFNLKRSSTIAPKTMLRSNLLWHIITECKPVLRVPLAASSSTAEHLCCTLASSAVSGMTRPEISARAPWRYSFALADTSFNLESPHDHMQPVFFSTYKTVTVLFGCRAIAQLHCEHQLVGSFGDRCIEGTIFYSDPATPCINVHYSTPSLQRRIQVQDFKSYLPQFPFKDASSLTCNTPAMLKKMSKVHEDDALDDNVIAIGKI